jgi:hypothetical protein
VNVRIALGLAMQRRSKLTALARGSKKLVF